METSRRSFLMQVHPRYNHVSSCHTDKDPRFPLPPRWYYLEMWHWSLTFWSSDCQEHQRALQTEFWSFKRGKKVLNGSDYDTKCTWAVHPHCSLQTDFLFSFGSNFSVHLRNYHPHLNCANFPLNEVFFISAGLLLLFSRVRCRHNRKKTDQSRNKVEVFCFTSFIQPVTLMLAHVSSC